mmetsp:Transcript_2247/g.3104  ORF Transcript_2247/g.3104 Transcript_2247/m.3104 type:complete len:293 (+) Transcript_2247:145-1023(+)
MSVIFLKLGGSLITNKREEESARVEVLDRVASEIAAALKREPSLRGRLIIGHGSGSFGHVYAHRYGIRGGCKTEEQWKGYALTADAASKLSRIVTSSLLRAGLPAWQIQPGSSIRCVNGKVVDGPIKTVLSALEHGLIPVVHGDMAMDDTRGGVVCSTEEVFGYLLEQLPNNKKATKIVLAGEVDGIFTADPQINPDAKVLDTITPESYDEIKSGLGGSYGVDVTGGMSKKVEQALQFSKDYQVDVIVCGGLVNDNLTKALLNKSQDCPGTCVSAVDSRSLQKDDDSGCVIC